MSTEMAEMEHIYVFGDQTVPVLDNLQKLLQVRNNLLLQEFLHQAFLRLRQEVAGLPAAERGEFPQAETLGLTLEAIRRGRHSAALDSAILSIYEVASYIQFVAQRKVQHPPASSCFLGFCTGSFAAAAISCSQTVFDIALVGSQAVVVAFRVGLHVQRRAFMLGSSEPDSWSSVFSSVNEHEAAQALSEFAKATHLPPLSRPYVGAVGSHTVTVSGSPNVLSLLLSSPGLADKKSHRLPILGPYHCSHAYAQSDLDLVIATTLEGVDCLDVVALVANMSCASGTVFERSTAFGTLLRESIADVLSRQIRVDRVLTGLSSVLVKTGKTTLVSFNAPIAQSLATSLARQGYDGVDVDGSAASVTSSSSSSSTRGGPLPDDGSSKIAIIGLSGRFPEADNLDEFWSVMEQGLDVHRTVPADRFDAALHYDATGRGKNTSRVQKGCWIKEPGQFDARFFHMSPREACQSDPAQRLALLTAYEAMEMAGFVPDRTPSTQRHRVGVFYGTTSDDWREVNSGQNIDTYFIPGGNRAFVPGRINYFFKFSGPSISVDTACSSSLAAINLACTSLLQRDCDAAVAGGTNVMTSPDNFAGLDRGHFLSTTGNCKTFDDGADGYCRADGVGTVVLKRLADAVADRDPIFGVILGAYTNHSAESVSITRPLADAQEFLFKKVLNESGVRPHDVGYIEMHGTGTQAGDVVELQSVLNTFAWDYGRASSAAAQLYIGSVKSNTGHAESASGVTALIKVLLMMQRNEIPPHCGIKGVINHGFPTDLDRRGVRIAMRAEEWKRPGPGRPRRAFVNNFSAAGGNTALLLEDAPAEAEADGSPTDPDPDPRAAHLVVVSARSTSSLKRNLRALADFVGAATPAQTLGRIAYTTTARRLHHSRRVAVVAQDRAQLQQLLLAAHATADEVKASPATLPGVGFLFTGQGAQYTAMAQQLYQNTAAFRADMDEMDAIGRGHGFPSVLPLTTGAAAIAQLAPTVIQLGTCVIQIALARLWLNLGVRPRFVLGHSLGEYAALHVAGALSISDTLYLCGRRAALLESTCTPDTHSMLAVKASQARLAQAVLGAAPSVEVACVNGPEDTVLSGTSADIDAVGQTLAGLAIQCTKLPVPFAFHSSQVDPVLDQLEEVAGHVHFQPLALPLVSTLRGAVVAAGERVGAAYIRRHCREPVQFLGAMEAARQSGIMAAGSLCLEIGTHPILTRLAKTIPGLDLRGCVPSLRRKEDNFKTLAESLAVLYQAGASIRWDGYHGDFAASQTVLRLPSYRWDLEKYWIQYQNDWCLTKGDDPVAAPPPPPAAKPVRLSSSVQAIRALDSDDRQTTIVALSDLHDPALVQVAQNHRVNDLILCPSSLYADVAYTLAKFAVETRFPDGRDVLPDICNMAVEKALIVRQDGPPQFLGAALALDWATDRGTVALYSADAAGNRTTLHAQCEIRLQAPQAWREDWHRHSYLIRRSIKNLLDGVDGGSTHKIRRAMAYRIFGSVVHYGHAYQGMQEVVLDSEGLEATARVQLQPPPPGHQYTLNPYWCDSFGHLTGFTMHANDVLDATDSAYINQGWRSMRCVEPWSPNVAYRSYVKMQPVRPGDDSAYAGDVYVLRDDEIVAVYGSVTFNKVSRRVLQMLLPKPAATAAASSSPARTRAYPPAGSSSASSTKLPSIRHQSSSSASTKLPSTRRQSVAASLSVLDQALQIVATEVGISVRQLTDDADFDDLGVDSLMSLTILAQFRELLNLDVPSSLFLDCLSVKALKDYLALSSPSSDSDNSSDDDSSFHHAQSDGTSATVPSLAGDDDAPAKPCDSAAASPVDRLMAILSDETGVSTKELRLADDLADLGVDSLVSLTVLGRAREELDLDLPTDLFMQHPTLASLQSALAALCGVGLSDEPAVVTPPATSVILQGRKSCSKALFLFPDGSGSSTSYVGLPTISPSLCVYGLDCPYVRHPRDLQCALQDLTPAYVAEIRRRQPHGPYRLAGWSAGGIAAYDAAQQLVLQGEVVDQLVLLDSPNPIGLEKLPPRFYRFLEASGVFGSEGGQRAPQWLIDHFLAFIDALDRYKPVPFRGAVPRTTLIWAKDGVCKNPDDARPERHPDDPKEMTWLLENRTNLGPNGWDQLLGKENIRISCVPGANHFSLVREPAASALVAIVREALV